ncbi:HK97 family phage prohead protease [Priestia megaterium]|uniref:HK97 family phage prohead protease n=3 Tax=Priestia megaterium TaxID=1404 RepID=UPI000BF6A092|nr:HK97 family phage prohead protease [Priestia megaterium]PFK02504.1 HK97 family phage prohead protease [Priestia megaterium]PMD08686.1 HK97 family phage prohead protease [Priestia megaterium]
MEKQKEIRKIDVESIETRATESNDHLIEGYINKFDKKSQFMKFFEQVDRNAFNRTLAQGHNIFGMYNHSSDKILGSTKTGSLKLSVDEVGLRFSLQINPNVSYAKDVYELVRSGDVDGCSFGFYVLEDEWSYQDDGTELRTILDLELLECTITPFPAYLDSEASVRSYDQFKNKQLEQQKQEEQRKLKQRQIAIELELL